MKKVWSISTTVRNPERLRNFLITLQELEGEVWNKETQLSFQIRLIKNRFYGFNNTQFYTGLSQDQIDLIDDINADISFEAAQEIFYSKNYVDADMRGRNSYKPLEKMGLCTLIDAKISITSLGKYLLGDDYDLGELFFKSFLKWQYPNPVDRDFNDSQIYNLKPFILTLHLINEVNSICREKGMKEKGISRAEFEIFGQTLLNYKDLKQQASELTAFRLELEKIKEFKEKKVFIEDFKDEFLKEFSNTDNLKDYADNTIRYFRLTRYIYIRGGGYYIDLEPRRKIEIESLLEKFDGSIEELSKQEYVDYISDINLPVLPWEEKSKLEKIYIDLLKDINDLEENINIDKTIVRRFEDAGSLKTEIEILRKRRHRLQDQLLKIDLRDVSKVDEVIHSLHNIRDLDLKPSIALEKYITRALHVINDAKEIRANSLVGDDNEFIFTAPANKPDIECFYESFNSICEVTMLNGRDQWHNEGQPVMRHFRDFENSSAFEDNYCIFVAPKMHRDTINTFWFSVKYEYEGKKQKIIPFTIVQIIEILEFIKLLKQEKKPFFHMQFQSLLESIVNIKDEVSTSDAWLRTIPQKIQDFKDELL